MSVIIKKPGKKVTSEDLDLFEAKTGTQIPSRYRSFLLKYNGGAPYPDCFYCVEFNGERVIHGIRDFFGIHREHSDLYDMIRASQRDDGFPRDMFPIGWDSFGNCTVVGMDGSPRAGRVYFWYHDQADGEQEVIEVAPSFEAFLEMLCVPPEIVAIRGDPPAWVTEPDEEPAKAEPPPEQLELFR